MSVIYSNTASDESGIEAFRRLAQNRGIWTCNLDITSNELFGLTSRVINESLTNVVVYFASTLYVSQFFEQYKMIEIMSGMQRQFLWIASDSWAGSDTISNLNGQYSRMFLGISTTQ